MKSVGIITQHRVNNWGSFLQAYATQLFFERIPDVRCEIIDYVYPNEFQLKNIPLPQQSLRSMIVKLANKLHLSNIQRKADRLNIAIEECLHLSSKFPTYDSLQESRLHYDLYVTGSDQTLNPKFTFGDTNFMFSWVKENNPKIISFAASMPGHCFPSEYEPSYKKYLSRYEAISVREQNCVDYLTQLTGTDVVCHLDPTLMLTGDEWIEQLSHLKKYKKLPDKYILLYKINHTFDAAPYIYDLTRHIQEKTGLPIVSLGSSIPNKYRIKGRNIKDAGPRDFVEMFSKASYVVTSSFHGTAFAINFGCPLYSIVPENVGEDSRQSNLLKLCKAENCIVPKGTPFDSINPCYDKEICDKILFEKRAEMKAFVAKHL